MSRKLNTLAAIIQRRHQANAPVITPIMPQYERPVDPCDEAIDKLIEELDWEEWERENQQSRHRPDEVTVDHEPLDWEPIDLLEGIDLDEEIELYFETDLDWDLNLD
jgi:hypothetical protein